MQSRLDFETLPTLRLELQYYKMAVWKIAKPYDVRATRTRQPRRATLSPCTRTAGTAVEAAAFVERATGARIAVVASGRGTPECR